VQTPEQFLWWISVRITQFLDFSALPTLGSDTQDCFLSAARLKKNHRTEIDFGLNLVSQKS
jgi:hypothetical protein